MVSRSDEKLHLLSREGGASTTSQGIAKTVVMLPSNSSTDNPTTTTTATAPVDFIGDVNDDRSDDTPDTVEREADKLTVTYDEENHLAILTQLNGSVWPKVLPWCVATLLFTYGIHCGKNNGFDMTMTNSNGHNFMSILVSFLVVTRATITYNRFMEARQRLSDLFRSAQELMQYACLFTLSDKGEAAKQWRQDVAYHIIVTIRIAVAAVEFRSYGVHAHDKLNKNDRERTPFFSSPELAVPSNNRRGSMYQNPGANLSALAHGNRTNADETMRAPLVWIYNLRDTILRVRTRPEEITPNHPLHANESLKLLAITSDIVTAYHGTQKLITTPFPFPLVQMTRTFLFFWIFSLPMVLLNSKDQLYEVMVLMFFCTYGFLGLEYVNIELDDPYGNDDNDFACQRWAEMVYEDTYIALWNTDGLESAQKLHRIISARTKRSALDNYHQEIHTMAFWRRRHRRSRVSPRS